MRISLKWLRELCPVELTDDEIAGKLTMAGLEVEGRHARGIGPNIVAAKVVSVAPVPGSDHLSVCIVDDKNGRHQVVCGAKNFAADDVVAYARPGAKLPGGSKIEVAKVRGVESAGMLLSERELGLSDDHSGLLLLPAGSPLGQAVDSILAVPDTLFEINVTPNRPDALSHVGIARELAALAGLSVRMPPAPPAGIGALPARVDVEDAERCPRYVARVLEGVHMHQSPPQVQERLRACGVRPINNVVDATNLALLELGHPLHAFDLDLLKGARIIVRRAREGEPLITLDGKERKLTADDLVIADAEKPVALAGVMGGQTSDISDRTKRVLLESAMFEPRGIRRSARRHGLHTEASHRFERGMDEKAAGAAADRCCRVIVDLAGGKALPGAIDRYPAPQPPTRVWVRPARVSAVLGARIEPAEVEQRLKSIGLEPAEGDAGRRLWTVPSWRRDLSREIDCVEEVARLRGYDTIPSVLHKAALGETAAARPEVRLTQAIRATLAAHGFDEVLNYSFVAERDLHVFAERAALRVANPLTVDQGAMRWTLLAGILRNVAHNLHRGVTSLRLYELGRAYLPEADPVWPRREPRKLALAVSGARARKSWTGGGEPADFYDLKGAIEASLEAIGIPGPRFEPATEPWFHPAAAAALVLGEGPVGTLGQIHPRVARHFEVPPQTYVAELDFAALLSKGVPLKTIQAVPRFPAVARDLAFVVDAAVPAQRMLEEIRSADAGGLLEQVTLFDVYRGAPIPEGKKNVAFGLSLRAPDRTLTDEEADTLCASIRARLETSLGAQIRAQ